MKSFYNIEKSAFRRREYVGYCAGETFRIMKSGTGGWECYRWNTYEHIRGKTLDEISEKLDRLAKAKEVARQNNVPCAISFSDLKN